MSFATIGFDKLYSYTFSKDYKTFRLLERNPVAQFQNYSGMNERIN